MLESLTGKQLKASFAELPTNRSDDRGQWNIGWWCLMTNGWAGGFCAGVTTVIYSCRSHQSEQFQCSSPSSHFNELGLSFNFAFPSNAISKEKYNPSLHSRYININCVVSVFLKSEFLKRLHQKCKGCISQTALNRLFANHFLSEKMTLLSQGGVFQVKCSDLELIWRRVV